MTFPEHGKAARDAAGWHVCLERLALALDVAADLACMVTAPPTSHRRAGRALAVVHRAYVERFGPEASAIGPPREWEAVHGPVDG